MPFSYQCQNPACKQIFETITRNATCSACWLGRLMPYIPADVTDRFPARGAALAADVVRFDNMATGATCKYKVTDCADRTLKIETKNGAAAARTVEIPRTKIVQITSGQLSEWVVLNRTNQPDWGHFGSTSVQAAVRAAGRAIDAPAQMAVYLRLGFQNPNDVHRGFGFIHVLFSHNRQKYEAVAEDLSDLIEALELRKYYTCAQHTAVHLDHAGFQRQGGICTAKFRGQSCGKALVEKANPKGVPRLFKSTRAGATRYVMTTEIKGSVRLAIIEQRDAVYNLVTMYTMDVASLRGKMTSGEFRLLYPKTF